MHGRWALRTILVLAFVYTHNHSCKEAHGTSYAVVFCEAKRWGVGPHVCLQGASGIQ